MRDNWNTTILFVDDEKGILKSYREVLQANQGMDLNAIRLSRKTRLNKNAVLEKQKKENGLKYNLLLASSGEEAIVMVEKEKQAGRKIAAGFFDMVMPGGIDGLETIRRLRKLDPEMLCAVVTACAERPLSNIANLFINQDEWIYFNKPFTSGELKQSVINLVSLWNRRHSEKQLLENIERNRRALVHLLQGLSKISRIPPLVIDALLKGIINIVLGLVKTKDAFMADITKDEKIIFKYGIGKYADICNPKKELPPDIYDFITSCIADKKVKSTKSKACIPLKFSHQIQGIIFIEKKVPHPNDIHLLEMFGMHAVNLIQNSRLYQDLENTNAILEQRNRELLQLLKKLTMTEESVQKLSAIAVTDELTQLSNRRFINVYLKKEFERARKLGYNLAYIMIDVDNFKQINDNYGHTVGDAVLNELAKIFLENKRSNDIIARYGGDEFLIVLCNVEENEAISFAERLRIKVHDYKFCCENKKLHLSLSVGLSIYYADNGEKEEDILKKADEALYKAKSNGGNRCVIL